MLKYDDPTLTDDEIKKSAINHRNHANRKKREYCFICRLAPSMCHRAHVLPVSICGPYFRSGAIPVVNLCRGHHHTFDELVFNYIVHNEEWRNLEYFKTERDITKERRLATKEKLHLQEMIFLLERAEIAFKTIRETNYKRKKSYHDEILEAAIAEKIRVLP